MKGTKRTVIIKLIRARLKRNMVELFSSDLGWLRVYIATNEEIDYQGENEDNCSEHSYQGTN